MKICEKGNFLKEESRWEKGKRKRDKNTDCFKREKNHTFIWKIKMFMITVRTT